jgi:glucose/arabinose dehydrogenase
MYKRLSQILVISLFLLTACQPKLPSLPTNIPTQEIPTGATAKETPTIIEEPTLQSTATVTQKVSEEPAEFQPLIRLEEVATGLTAPVDLDAPGDGSGRLFVTDQIGLIRVIDGEDNLLDEPLLNLQEKMVNLNGNYDERGLLGLAIHPDFANNGRFFVYYSAPLRSNGIPGYNHTSILSEFTVSSTNINRADPDSERVILEVDQPQANHNAGAIAFGPDGYLYVPLGDGGGANDTGVGHAEDWYAVNAGGNGQDVADNLLGSVLRIDIDNGNPYAVPQDNPQISETYPEIWAYGFRNPYRMAFDPEGSNELFLGDAGQDLWEEVSIVIRGGNYGWNVREGTHCFSTSNPTNPQAITDCPTETPNGEPLIDPIIEFPNSRHPTGGLGTTVVGGVVYRGELLPAWDGRYIFGQWSTSFRSPQGTIFVAERADQGLWSFEAVQIANREGGALGAYLLGFGQDQLGEVYVLTSLSSGPSGATGGVFRIISP